ncbi:MAG TPA: LysR substrate-binding domain-containing protein [Candidatus Limnocylindrales bacterium]|nr:LysR substrate-binding domain-containing protein [Candidatus Limnocylindrales bacterium]
MTPRAASIPVRRALPARTFEQQVTVHQLRIFKEVADRRSFSRAAEALHLSQPAVSHQIKTLAQAVQLPLFEEIARRIHLTAAGRLLYEYAARILTDFEATGRAFDELRGLRRGALRVTGDTTVGIYVLPDLLGAFRAAHPDVDVRLDVGNRQHAYERLLANETDFAVVGHTWPRPAIPLTVRPFLPNELIAVAAPGHPLAGAGRISVRRLAAEPFILREPGSGTRETTEEALRRSGLAVDAVMELSSNGAIKRAVARGLGITIISRYAVALELKLGLLVELRVAGFPLRRQWHLVYLRDRRLGPVDEAFLAFIDEGGWRSGLGESVSTD